MTQGYCLPLCGRLIQQPALKQCWVVLIKIVSVLSGCEKRTDLA